jgi:hypothetical protein
LKLAEAAPRVKAFESANSTFHNVAAKLKAARSQQVFLRQSKLYSPAVV